jgi:ATP synthase protein I
MDGKAGERSGASPLNPILAILLAQLALSMALAAVFWGVSGSVAGYSALLGGLTCVIPNAFLALRAKKYFHRRSGRLPVEIGLTCGGYFTA